MKRLRLVAVIVFVVSAAAPLAARGSREAGELVGPDDAYELVRAGDAILVDVRGPDSYAESHIAGALNVPLGEVGSRAEELAARNRTIVTYCSCPAEETSIAAADVLIAHGVEDVLVLRGGIRGWAVERLPLRSGTRP
ncbi:MAG: rhodanese-like domain-containing protein [Spirochaetota bacterium]